MLDPCKVGFTILFDGPVREVRTDLWSLEALTCLNRRDGTESQELDYGPSFPVPPSTARFTGSMVLQDCGEHFWLFWSCIPLLASVYGHLMLLS